MDAYRFARNRVMLAPLAGVTDQSFRSLCAEQGAGLTFTEMVSAKGVQYGNRRTYALIGVSQQEGRAGVQLFGNDPAPLADTAARLCEECAGTLAVIDLNMGCPAPKIVNNREGAALMRDPALAYRIIRAVKDASTLPVTVKFRKGFDRHSVNAVAFAQMAEQAGADAVSVHGRTRDQFYEGKADWEIIAEVKRAVEIPVNGNGDIFTPEDAKRMLEQTGVDGLLVARGALGNPFLFAQILQFLQTGNYAPVPPQARLDMAMRHARLACAQKGERVAMREMRKHACWYVKGMNGAARLREQLVRINTLAELDELLEGLRATCK